MQRYSVAICILDHRLCCVMFAHNIRCTQEHCVFTGLPTWEFVSKLDNKDLLDRITCSIWIFEKAFPPCTDYTSQHSSEFCSQRGSEGQPPYTQLGSQDTYTQSQGTALVRRCYDTSSCPPEYHLVYPGYAVHHSCLRRADKLTGANKDIIMCQLALPQCEVDTNPLALELAVFALSVWDHFVTVTNVPLHSFERVRKNILLAMSIAGVPLPPF